jgi:hypothetical protein
MSTEVRFLVKFYNSIINYYDSIECSQPSELELLKIATEASSLYKILLDYYDEGYTYLADPIIAQTDALERLDQFLTTSSASSKAQWRSGQGHWGIEAFW